ncbi:muramoyltetrapeptide carboxypeptidase [Novosphingobium kunmingense]|uniref:Muramoyltetrapeptide carboxypeptidase n=1 Tax=Novosphingobium kunmingense TaxID=1211806 RepID=A0A2N0I3L3_9SPHN|nr:LD-carboxypeptidase [Novosphingobium kunmingense]PKB25782.1 muramoyltetrapeptide carboxypeptidase [Novosphingobium kunmingense]
MARVAICAPSRAITEEMADRVLALASDYPGLELQFHPQCFLTDGHFAGSDAQRRAALAECANDPAFDSVWAARGGYGAVRIVEDVLGDLGQAAQDKRYLAYSDGGTLLAGLYRHGIGQPVHAPMPADIARDGGEGAVRRSLAYLAGEHAGLEPGLDSRPVVAFNLMTLAMVCGTPLMPDLSGHVVMVEEVAEHLYAIDRLFFHVTAHLGGIAGLRLGRVGDVPENDIDFGQAAPQIARHWCERHGIRFLGEADIGHDVANKIVPFGLAGRGAAQ